MMKLKDIVYDLVKRIGTWIWRISVPGNLFTSSGVERMTTIRHYLMTDGIKGVYIQTDNGSLGIVDTIWISETGSIQYEGKIRPRGGLGLLPVVWDGEGVTIGPSKGIARFKLRYITGLNRS